MPAFSKFETAPTEILEEIVLCAVNSTFLGPPIVLPPLLRLSHIINNKLSRQNNPGLYARIFLGKFDVRAARRRLGDSCIHVKTLAVELVRRCEGLKRLKRNNYPRGVHGDKQDGGLRVDLWMAYIMFLESDGRNARQLVQYARIDILALEFVVSGGRLHDGMEGNDGWTIDSEVNALGMWLFWFTDNSRFLSETLNERDQILDSLGCIYVGSFKYTSTHAPLTSFIISHSAVPNSLPHPFDVSISLLPICIVPNHFGIELSLAHPLVTSPALLACVVRLGDGRRGDCLPRNSRAPATRAQAVAAGWTGATVEDYEAFSVLRTPCVEWGDSEESESHQDDWMRLFLCGHAWSEPTIGDNILVPGMLDGIWEGRWLAVPPDFFQSLRETAKAPTPLQPPVFQYPMQFRLWEHHQHNPEGIVKIADKSLDGVGNGSLSAWLPAGTTTVKQNGHLVIHDPSTHITSMYKTYDPLRAVLDNDMPLTGINGYVWDIILTAETEDKFNDAWGHDRYLGRVRGWDGQVMLVRQARHGAGCWVFRGYVHGGRNLVGRWRETSTPVDAPGWEGVWTVAKRPE